MKFIKVYHGTNDINLKKILSEKILRGYYGWGIGVCTNVSRAMSYSMMSTQVLAKKLGEKWNSEFFRKHMRVIEIYLNFGFTKYWQREGNAGVMDAFILHDSKRKNVYVLDIENKKYIRNYKVLNYNISERELGKYFKKKDKNEINRFNK